MQDSMDDVCDVWVAVCQFCAFLAVGTVVAEGCCIKDDVDLLMQPCTKTPDTGPTGRLQQQGVVDTNAYNSSSLPKAAHRRDRDRKAFIRMCYYVSARPEVGDDAGRRRRRLQFGDTDAICSVQAEYNLRD